MQDRTFQFKAVFRCLKKGEMTMYCYDADDLENIHKEVKAIVDALGGKKNRVKKIEIKFVQIDDNDDNEGVFAPKIYIEFG